MMKLKGVQYYQEVLNETADSIEAINNTLFTCGTYQLLENETKKISSSKRVGTLILYENKGENVVKLQEVSTNAILDKKWFKSDDNVSILSVADSLGNAIFFELNDKQLVKKCEKLIDDNSLCLSTDWCHTTSPNSVLYSLSNGELVHYQYSTNTVINSWKAHSLEAWIVANDFHNTNLVYSGADDCLLKMWDLRSLMKPCSMSKYYMMGVCSIQSNPFKEYYFAVGSYDETVCIWDSRNFKSPVTQTETGGGVWRVKWHPFITNYLLTASMHDGFKIIKYNDCFRDGNVILSYGEHESLAYGVDWLVDQSNVDGSPNEKNINSSNIASCSFYDKKLTVWKVCENL